MDLLSSIKLPHWLMIAGVILIATGFFGLVFTRNKQAATNPDSEPRVPPPSILRAMTVHGHRRLVELKVKKDQRATYCSGRSRRRCRGRIYHLFRYPAAATASRGPSAVAANLGQCDRSSRYGDIDEHSAPKYGNHLTAYQRSAAVILRRAPYAQASASTSEPPIIGHIALPKRRPTSAHDSQGNVAGSDCGLSCAGAIRATTEMGLPESMKRPQHSGDVSGGRCKCLGPSGRRPGHRLEFPAPPNVPDYPFPRHRRNHFPEPMKPARNKKQL